MRRFYLVGAILGFIVPYLFFGLFLIEHGLDLELFLDQMFGSPIAAFFAVDVIITSIVLWGFIFSEGRKLGMKHLWIYIVAHLLVGVSLALPLFLYFREPHLDKELQTV